MLFQQNKKFLLTVIFTILLCADFALAAKLEVKYPISQSGISIVDTNTPIPLFLKYIFDFGMFLGFATAFYSLAYAGILYLWSGAQPERRSEARDRVWGAVSGVLILALSYLIITTLNPQLKFFKLGELQEIPPIASNRPPGVYFFTNDTCAGDVSQHTSNINDFGTNLTNKVGSALIVNNPNMSFVSTIYSSPNLWGKCLDIDPNNYSCQRIERINSSASIHIYDFNPDNNPDNDGVYFYRKTFFNPEGGFLKISNYQIQKDGFFSGYLSDLSFQDVPEKDKICIKWDKNNTCTEKKDPSLAGREISSIKIAGNYIVYFVYFDPQDNPAGPWEYCQEFPAPYDINREGPQQFRWEATPNQKKLANWVYIYPVKSK